MYTYDIQINVNVCHLLLYETCLKFIESTRTLNKGGDDVEEYISRDML